MSLVNKNEIFEKASKIKVGAFFSSLVHLQNENPKHLFEERRPYESLTDHALEYRIKNYRNETYALFQKSIQDIEEVLNESNISIETESKELQEFTNDFYKWENLKYYDLNQYFKSFVLQNKLADANGVLAIIPIKKGSIFNASDIGFEDLGNSKISVDIRLFNCDKIVFQSDSEIKIEAGLWTLENGEKKPYYLIYNRADLFLEIPTENENKIVPYYSFPTLTYPIINLGKDIGCKDGVKYFLSEYFGALQVADKYVGIDSDLTVIDSRSHPNKYVFKQNCTADGCHYSSEHKRYGYVGIEGFSLCGICKGTGEINADTSPFTTFKIEKKDGMNSDNIEVRNPIGYASPPVDILNYKKGMCDFLFNKLANSLCVSTSQNNTNQSGESKRYDVGQKVTLISNICEDVVRIMQQTLFFVGAILENKPTSDVEVIKPTEWNIKVNGDLITEINEAKTANAPYFILLKLVKELLNLQYKSNPNGDKIVDFLIKKDKLIVYGLNDLTTARGIFGEDITIKDIYTHQYAPVILEKLFADKELMSKEIDIEAEFEKEISAILPPQKLL